MTDMNPILRLSDIRVQLPDGAGIVEDFDLELNPGEIVGLVGESGSGKTTAALAIFGYTGRNLTLTSGEIMVANQKLSTPKMFRTIRGRQVSYVPQNPATSLNPSMRIGKALDEMIRFGLGGGHAAQTPLELLEHVGLPGTASFAARFPHQLSGGQQQRVCIAAALASDPVVVVLDEPTTGLDVVTQDLILKELLRLRNEEHVSMLYITHDLAVVAQIADRIAVMYAGRIVEQGPTDQILGHPKHPYTKGLMASTPDHLLSRVLETMEGTTVGVGERPNGCPFAPRCPQRVSPRCDEELPELERIGRNHQVRCFEWQRTPSISWRSTSSTAPSASNRQSTPVVLELEDVRAHYGSGANAATVTSDISFQIVQGGCVALVGESGSGKTTLARVIAGLHPDFSGRVLLNGDELPHLARRRSIHQRRQVQIVFQSPADALNPRHSVEEIVARPARILRSLDRNAARHEVERLLDAVRLPARIAQRYPGELSGGECQRVAIARALSAGPELIVCDEVTSALDVSVQAVVLELLADLRNQFGLSLLFITHDLGVVAAVADDVLVLDHGKICERGEVAEVLRTPRNAYTQTLLAAAPSLSAVIASWDSGVH